MLAAVVTAVGGPWEMQNVPQPEAGPGQILVKMHASGICYADVHETLGHLPGKFPRILGHESFGEIVAIGPGLTSRKVGDRVGVGWIQWAGLEYLYEALDFVAKGKVKVIAETYKLDEAPKAFQRVLEGKARFRAVLTM